jgi:ribose/xylose/arabinose/galactoside ABC-type transport system permease subunit
MTVSAARRLTGGRGLASLRSGTIFTRYGIVVALVAIFIALSLTAENFFTVSNLMNIVLQASNTGIMAAGLTAVVIAAEIDLSVASVQSLAAVCVALLIVNAGMSVASAVALTLVLGALIGSFSGALAGWFGIPAFIVTLAVDSLARGGALIATDETSIYGLPDSFSFLGQGYIGPVPVAGVICILAFTAVHLLLTRTVIGTNIYAVGGNKEAARVAGINVFAVKLVVMTVSGICAALAGIVLASRVMGAQANMGQFDLMDVIAAVVIGGASLLGGEGSVFGTVIGTLVIACIRNGLNLLGIPADWQLIAVGLIIVLAVLLDYVGRKRVP